jgi:LPXTG-motif cell wall-anchored protein
MARGKTFKKRFLSFMMTILMVAAIVVPSVPVYAVEDKIDVGQPAYNAVNGTMTYYNCLGTGVNLYKSLVINFTSVRENGEEIILPSVDGFRYETTLSTDSTYIINIPDGKNLVQIAAYIRKIQFKNCQNSAQKINFSIGKELVQYMTFYSEDSQHYYQFIRFDRSKTSPGASITDPSGKTHAYGTWEWAYYTALNMSYEGLQGYLATVSTVEEDAFIYRCSNQVGWLGGTRMNPGTLDTKNGIPHYNTFTRPAQNAAGTGYWFWASGPDVEVNGGRFLGEVKGTDTNLRAADNNGQYNNWNSGEPNNSGGIEYTMTTLKIGTGWTTGARSGKINSSSPYYVASGYSWNDIKPDNWNQYGRGETYEATGFFVEYGDYVKGLSKTALVQKTNFEFKTTTQPLSHIWNLYAPEGSDTVRMYCTASDPKCSYYAPNGNNLGETIDLTISAEDVPFDGNAYSSVSITGGADIVAAANNNATVSEVKYYKVSTADTVTGGTALTAAPKQIGYYYAEVTVTVKNTVLATNTVTGKAVVPFKIYDPDADYAVESLNNKTNDEIPYQRKVTAGTAYSNLEVVLATAGDHFEMYKLADMNWNSEKGTLNNMDWVPAVKSWLNNSSYANTVTSPYDLANGKASSSTISSFYKDMLKSGDESVFNAAGGDNLVNLIADSSGQYTGTHDKYVDGAGTEVNSSAQGATRYSVVFDDIKYGIYAILAEDSGDNPYAVTVAAVYPQQSGPKGNFYTQELFTVYIKEVEPTIDKYINDKKQDIAAIDDTENPIKFDIDFQLPQYKDRLTTGDGSGYQLSFEDQMAPGFTMYQDDTHTIEFFYIFKDKNDEDEDGNVDELLEEPIAANGIPSAISYKFTENSIGSNSIPISQNNAKEGTVEYVANPTSTTVLTKNTDLRGYYATPRTSPIFEPFEVYDAENGNTVIKITFDEPAVRSWKTSLPAGRDLAGFRIRYYATLNADAAINSNANSNTAYIHYEKDSSGKSMTEMHDTVYAYTYGLNIVKIDGSADETTYLQGAQFVLYKEMEGTFTEDEISTFTGANYYTIPASGNDDARYFKKVVMNNGTFQRGTSSNEYDTLISEATEAGITAKGLTDGKYILVETRAPRGYNELAEDIYFEINKLADNELALANNSYIWFREMETDEKHYVPGNIESVILNENGCISIDVYNYQGLTLPSTGGMGILLFVIIGTLVMGSVIVILLKRRRQIAE